MKEYLVRFLIVGIMAVCITLLFLGGRQANAEALNTEPEWIWPAEGIISDTFGTRGGRHKGIDIAGNQGAVVRAANEGKIEKSYYSSTYGNVILINHPNGYVSVYAHLDKRLADEGMIVSKGEQIGTMGNTGYSTGVHLHFELHNAEWTTDKKNAFNPSSLLGTIGTGDSIAFNGLKNRVAAEVDEGTGVKMTGAAGDILIHTVKDGDTLWAISIKYNVSIGEIQKKNSIKGSKIYPGQELSISGQGLETAHLKIKIMN
ncbi:LysM peptidoglycan-binding domain-containing protein [Neobacillus notoginsengisoli]|uniref:LysM peptidoglycan-binding domain-containing protein n=1 Tax=Neobacillus notoginsengisoli TaxID=1578198 RepID=A0A417YV87_9BACI|nr:peptidoglycan DD-metalloendopeptidase family protein [Neobacillus notoginsengisoli]RHW41214.1 LysM peptidoglycan-binding domain-containing protein [Neobacillus notoginsengisoli]